MIPASYVVTVQGRHMMVEREDGKPIRCGWDTLQEIKNAYLGADVCAVEIFPPADEVVNEINRRHFFVVDGATVPSLLRRSF